MRTVPRRFRPHEIKLIKELPENDKGIAEDKIIAISYVKVDPSYGIQQSKKGIITDDKIACYIELKDYVAHNQDEERVLYGPDFIIVVGDTITYRDKSYVVTSISEIMLYDDEPIRLEVIAK